MKVMAVIPARMGSSRFPGKPLALINGTPMIQLVYEAVSSCNELDLVVVATCDIEIYDFIESIGGKAVMTGNHHERASDRCAEAAILIENETGTKFDVVVLVQGDEPMTRPEMISDAITPFWSDPAINVVNLIAPINNLEEFNDPNCIKVVTDSQNNALYFSRSPIPVLSEDNLFSMNKQVCIIPFSREFLQKYAAMKPTPLEVVESIDMLRVLENGFSVKMVPTAFSTKAVDTHEDLVAVEKLMSPTNL